MFRVTVEGLPRAQRKIKRLGTIGEKAARESVNATARKMRTRVVQAVRSEVKLPARYVRDRVRVTLARKGGQVEASVEARSRPTLLYRFGAKQLTKKAAGAKGDPVRGISTGRKAAGVSVHVGTEGRSKVRSWFLLPLKSGRMGVAKRVGVGPKKVDVLYGPSVDQVTTTFLPVLETEGLAMLRKDFRERLVRLVRAEALK